MAEGHDGLPEELSDRITVPLARFLKIESAAGGLLLAATLTALLVANSPWSDQFLALWQVEVGLRVGRLEFSRSVQHWINDGLMTIFFFVIALELKREIILGELRSFRKAALPFAGALGGMLVPVLTYLVLMRDNAGAHGWGTVMATDTAFVVAGLALFGARLPQTLRLFLLSLAIFDDVGAIIVVAVAYAAELKWLTVAGALLALVGTSIAARLGIRNLAVYVFLGVLTWLLFDRSGIHPTIAGVVFGLMTPTGAWISNARLHAILGKVLSNPRGESSRNDTANRNDLRRAGVAATEAVSPVERLELKLHPWASFGIMPVFAFANAGIPVSTENLGHPLSIAVFAGLFLGKPVGVFVASWLAVRTGLAAKASQLSWGLLAAGATLTGIGFTMSLFIAELAYEPELIGPAKLGILVASTVSATTGLVLLGFLSRRHKITRSAGNVLRG